MEKRGVLHEIQYFPNAKKNWSEIRAQEDLDSQKGMKMACVGIRAYFHNTP